MWKEKKNYGKMYMGIERSAFLIGPDGTLQQAWYKISPKDTPVKLLQALESVTGLPAPADLLPHRPPFLFVDEVLSLEPGVGASGRVDA